ncbi:hypothetical protein BZG36_02216 [Bifiguratus adelaidae]|uniref:Large ribosomal subunit protein uL5m n=1 Tax=Bifiguratus adelaidae TaxID=1938954 RepID=A0A261Y3G9_9FUNG|nr:hypothetical protein BZG36_02216 [Bifiguratus adelaidae]
MLAAARRIWLRPLTRSFSTTGPSLQTLVRAREHFHSTIEDDLLLLTFDHGKSTLAVPSTSTPSLNTLEQQLNSTSATTALSDSQPTKRKGNKPLKPKIKPTTPTNIPTLEKITVHAMVKDAIHNKTHLLSAFMALQGVSAVRPEVIFAKNSVAQWKLREGMPIGVKVTLRGAEMYTFLDKLVELVLPRLRDFSGFPASAGDGNGNIGVGFPPSALALFPEIENTFDMYPRMTGFDVVFCTTAQNNADARLLMSGFGVPFIKR